MLGCGDVSEVEGLEAGDNSVGDDTVPGNDPETELGLIVGDVREGWGVCDDAFDWTPVSAGDSGDAEENSGDEAFSAPGALSGDGGEEVGDEEVATEFC